MSKADSQHNSLQRETVDNYWGLKLSPCTTYFTNDCLWQGNQIAGNQMSRVFENAVSLTSFLDLRQKLFCNCSIWKYFPLHQLCTFPDSMESMFQLCWLRQWRVNISVSLTPYCYGQCGVHVSVASTLYCTVLCSGESTFQLRQLRTVPGRGESMFQLRQLRTVPGIGESMFQLRQLRTVPGRGESMFQLRHDGNTLLFGTAWSKCSNCMGKQYTVPDSVE